jgi:signal transduction histidine kinase
VRRVISRPPLRALTSIRSMLSLVLLLVVGLVAVSVHAEATDTREQVHAEAGRYSAQVAEGVDGLIDSAHLMLYAVASTAAVRRQDEAATVSLFQSIRNRPGAPRFEALFASRIDGWQWAASSADSPAYPVFVGDRAYFHDALKGQLGIEYVAHSRHAAAGHHAIAMAYPVRAQDSDELNGVVIAAISKLPLEPFLPRLTRLPAGAAIEIVDIRTGTILGQWPDSDEHVGRNVRGTAMWNALEEGATTIDQAIWPDGNSRLTAHTRTYGAEWVVAVGLPAAAVGQPVWRHTILQALLLAPPMLVIVVLVVGLGRATAEAERRYEREQLARAQVEHALRQRDEFLSTAAHELKTPVTSLSGTAQLALRRLNGEALPAPVAARTLTLIDRQARRLGRMVELLLDTTRLGTGTLRLKCADNDLIELVRAATEHIQERSSVHNLVLHLPDAPVTANVDALRIEQLLTHLLDNAVRYSPEGGTIEVSIDVGETDSRISVRDSGIGIPPERREGIFNRYYQAHHDGHLSGLGLSLSISREIAGMHGGSIHAEHPDDGGTRFVVTLPRSKRNSPYSERDLDIDLHTVPVDPLVPSQSSPTSELSYGPR